MHLAYHFMKGSMLTYCCARSRSKRLPVPVPVPRLLVILLHALDLPLNERIDVDIMLCQKLIKAAAAMAVQEGANMGVAEG